MKTVILFLLSVSVLFSVTARAASPVANHNPSLTTNDDTAITITLQASDADAGDLLTYSVVTQPYSSFGNLGTVT